MLKFTTTTPFLKDSSPEEILATVPLITVSDNVKLSDGKLQGLSAKIVGKALTLAGFDLPCFFEGEICELDKTASDSDIRMVLPSGSYRITSRLDKNGVYLLDLRKK